MNATITALDPAAMSRSTPTSMSRNGTWTRSRTTAAAAAEAAEAHQRRARINKIKRCITCLRKKAISKGKRAFKY